MLSFDRARVLLAGLDLSDDQIEEVRKEAWQLAALLWEVRRGPAFNRSLQDEQIIDLNSNS